MHNAFKIKKHVRKKVWNNYFKFCIVRNPWDRYLSIFKNRERRINFNFKNFEGWIDFLYNQYKSQTLSLADNCHLDWICNKKGEVIVDYIARFENYADEWIKISKIIKSEKPMKHANWTKHKHYSLYYNDSMIEKVREMSKRDIEYFGYEFIDMREVNEEPLVKTEV